MPAPVDLLLPRVRAALGAAFGDEFADADPVIRPSQFADVQVNAALALAKRLGMPPREVASRIADELREHGIQELAKSVEVSGPGFINIAFADEFIADQVTALASDARLGVPREEPQIIPIDYSAPNVAKEMHVGHLRTTVVGDCLARTLECLGHNVIRQNHIGDWGTPMGMLLERLQEVGPDSAEAAIVETEPNTFYQAARASFDADPAWADRARAQVVALQSGDPIVRELWNRLYDRSKVYFERTYGLLGVTLTEADLAGESTYNDQLAGICDELEAAGVAVMSEGALCVFLDGFTGREGKPMPLIIRKSDGGYGYGTTDLVTIKYRTQDLRADRILYVVGVTQALHLQMVFATARKMGWLRDGVEAIHVAIGTVLGPDRKMLKTREGDPMLLGWLLGEALAKAQSVIDAARPELGADERAVIARQIGIGSVKYADLSVAHDTDYTFDLDRMVSLTGNTGPYMQYAAARIQSIFRDIATDPVDQHAPVVVRGPQERELALHLVGFGAAVAAVGETLEPHRLCNYLFELAQKFSVFYENCPVLKADVDEVRDSRLTLCAVTQRVIVTGLDLLGIETPDQM